MVSLERKNGHVMVVVSLMEGEWLCYRGGQFNRGRMVMLQRGSLLEGEWSCYRSSHYWREKGHVTEVESLMEGEWSC